MIDKKKWRNIVKEREKEMNQSDHQMAEKKSTRRERNKQKKDRRTCRKCGKRFETTRGMKIH